MEFNELLLKRRSVRAYTEPAPHDAIRDILIKAQQAPSWAHTQNARCYVVESPEMLEDFRNAVLPEFNQKNSANAALIVTTFVKGLAGFSRGIQMNEPGEEWGAYDLGLHDAYLIFAARDAGYDTLIMGARNGEMIREMLGIPENEEVMSVIAIGKQAAEPNERTHKDPDEVIRFF